MANFMWNETRRAARATIWLFMLFLVFQRVFPFILSNVPHLWILINRRKFIYIILNIIIISILISSSSSFTPSLTDIFVKLLQKTKLRLKISFHNDDSCYNCQKAVDPLDDDTWWFLTTFDHEYIMKPATEEDKGEERYHIHVEEKETRKEEKEEEIGEDDSLDATWKAIMESKGKESGPQLKKSGRWSYGIGEVDERKKERGSLSKYRVKDELKEWQRSAEMAERGEIFDGDGSCDRKRGWRSMEAALTFHDDLKRRADAFIARFTHDIHLQRLESDQRFLDMINRGT